MTARVCSCGSAVPKGRKRHCSDGCARKAWKKAEYEAKAKVSRTVEPGTERGGLTYMPGHPIARRNGWIGTRRLRGYNERDGECVCEATDTAHEWSDANVVEVDGRLIVLCQAHTRVRSFGAWLAESGFGGSDGYDIALRLSVLWTAPCPPAGESSVSEDDRGCTIPPPQQVVEGDIADPIPPVHQVGIS